MIRLVLSLFSKTPNSFISSRKLKKCSNFLGTVSCSFSKSSGLVLLAFKSNLSPWKRIFSLLWVLSSSKDWIPCSYYCLLSSLSVWFVLLSLASLSNLWCRLRLARLMSMSPISFWMLRNAFIENTKVLPWPLQECAKISPPKLLQICLQIESPIPLPVLFNC